MRTPRERRAEHISGPKDAVEEACAALERRPRPLDELGQHRVACRLPGCVQEPPGEDERKQRGERQPDRVEEHRHEQNRQAAGEIREDAGAVQSEPVDDNTAECGRDQDRQQREEACETRLRHAARCL